MKLRIREKVLFAGAGVVLLLGGGVSGVLADVHDAEAIFLSLGNGRSIYSRYYSGNVFGGVLLMDVDGDGDADEPYEKSFCIDLFTPIRRGDSLVVNGPLSDDVRSAVNWTAVNCILHNYTPNTNSEAAAIQAAIWYFVTEPYGPYDGTGGKYQFMTDPEAGRSDAEPVRSRAFEIINATLTGCAGFEFPTQVDLAPESAIQCSGNVTFTATVFNQTAGGMGGVNVTFEAQGGTLNSTAGVTDAAGEASVELEVNLATKGTANVTAYATGKYGTLLYDPSGEKQPLTTISLVPHSIADSSSVRCEPDPGIDVEKYVSTDGINWMDADNVTGPEVLVGHNVSFKFEVTNVGEVELTSVNLTDSVYDVSSCSVPSTLAANASFECVIGPFAAEPGQHTNTANATGEYEGTVYGDSDDANYFGIPTYRKSGSVFYDKDADGVKDVGETGAANVTVFLCLDCEVGEAAPCSTIDITSTDGSGQYEFTGLTAGNYVVSVPSSTDCQDANEALYAGYAPVVVEGTVYDDEVGRFCIFFQLEANETGNDFGFAKRTVAVGGWAEPVDRAGVVGALLWPAAGLAAAGITVALLSRKRRRHVS